MWCEEVHHLPPLSWLPFSSGTNCQLEESRDKARKWPELTPDKDLGLWKRSIP